MGEKDFAWYVFFGMGMICLCFWVGVLFLDLQTSEVAWGAPHTANVLQPNLWLIAQPVQFIMGWLPVNMVIPALVAWVIELFVQGGTLVLEKVIANLNASNKRLGKVFWSVCIIAFVIDAVTNWQARLYVGELWKEISFIIVLAMASIFLPWFMITCFIEAKKYSTGK